MKAYRFKISTGSLFGHKLAKEPLVGERIILPFPTGGNYTALITSYVNDIFFGEWL